MCRLYDKNIIGQVMEAIVEHHKDEDILYTFNEEAEGVFEVITDKLNDQFNLKYTSCSQISSSQPDLDNNEKSVISSYKSNRNYWTSHMRVMGVL